MAPAAGVLDEVPDEKPDERLFLAERGMGAFESGRTSIGAKSNPGKGGHPS
jgi:hypothetical protein